MNTKVFLLVICVIYRTFCIKEKLNQLKNIILDTINQGQQQNEQINQISVNSNNITKDSTIKFGREHFPDCINNLDIYDRLKQIQVFKRGGFGQIVKTQFGANNNVSAFKIIPYQMNLDAQRQLEEDELINNEILISKKMNQVNSVQAVRYIDCFVGQDDTTLQFFIIIQYEKLGDSLEFSITQKMDKSNNIIDIYIGRGYMYQQVPFLKRQQNFYLLFQSLSSLHNDHKIGNEKIVLRDIKPQNIMTNFELQNISQEQILGLQFQTKTIVFGLAHSNIHTPIITLFNNKRFLLKMMFTDWLQVTL